MKIKDTQYVKFVSRPIFLLNKNTAVVMYKLEIRRLQLSYFLGVTIVNLHKVQKCSIALKCVYYVTLCV